MKACSVDIGLLRENLEHYIDHELDNIVNSEKLSDPQPTAGFKGNSKIYSSCSIFW